MHGGWEGFHKKVWNATQDKDSQGNEFIESSYLSADGEEGYPGNLNVTVRYTLTQDNAMRIEYNAQTDKPTVVNLTNHAFFNLSGNPHENVNMHQLLIHSDSYIACDKQLIPTGEIISCKNTPIDFNKEKTIGSSLYEKHPEILFGKGYAIAFTLNTEEKGLTTFAASLACPKTGIKLDIYTNQPSLQFYNAWLLDGSDIGKNNIPYYSGAGVVLETQGFPNAPNHANFPSIIVTSDKEYYHIAEYKFGTI